MSNTDTCICGSRFGFHEGCPVHAVDTETKKAARKPQWMRDAESLRRIASNLETESSTHTELLDEALKELRGVERGFERAGRSIGRSLEKAISLIERARIKTQEPVLLARTPEEER